MVAVLKNDTEAVVLIDDCNRRIVYRFYRHRAGLLTVLAYRTGCRRSDRGRIGGPSLNRDGWSRPGASAARPRTSGTFGKADFILLITSIH